MRCLLVFNVVVIDYVPLFIVVLGDCFVLCCVCIVVFICWSVQCIVYVFVFVCVYCLYCMGSLFPHSFSVYSICLLFSVCVVLFVCVVRDCCLLCVVLYLLIGWVIVCEYCLFSVIMLCVQCVDYAVCPYGIGMAIVVCVFNVYCLFQCLFQCSSFCVYVCDYCLVSV